MKLIWRDLMPLRIYKARSHSESRLGRKGMGSGAWGVVMEARFSSINALFPTPHSLIAVFALFAFFVSPLHTAPEVNLPNAGGLPNIYVAPKGSPNGNGTLEHPLDLATVLSDRSPARPGA